MKLVLAVVRAADLQPLLERLSVAGLRTTVIEDDALSASGSLAAFVAGVADDDVADVLAIVRDRARTRVEAASPLPVIGERAEFWIPATAEQMAGGASVFVLAVRRFERIGYA